MRRIISSLNPGRLVIALVVLAVLVQLGSLLQHVDHRLEPFFSLDGELSLEPPVVVALPALVSAAVLVAAGILWLVASRSLRPMTWAGLLCGLGLVGMAFDELFEIHERFEGRFQMDWQLIYLPVIVALGVAGLLLCRRLWRDGMTRPMAPLFAGGGLWVVAQVFEKIQWEGHVKQPSYPVLMPLEEAFELMGSGLIAVAAVMVLREVELRRTSRTAAADQRRIVRL